jgi:PAS domain S-box-containing protein
MNLQPENPPSAESLAEFDFRLIDQLPVAAYVCAAPSGDIVRFNAKAAELWGRAPQMGTDGEKVCGSHRVYQIDGTPIPAAKIPMLDVLHEGIVIRDQEVILERPDGSRIYVAINIDPILNHAGEVIGAINVFLDISERKLAERQSQQLLDIIHAEFERLTRFFEHSPAFMAVLRGPQHIYEKANKRYLSMIGREEVLGLRVADVLPELESQGFIAKLDEVYQTGQNFVGRDIPVTLQDETGVQHEKIVDVVYEPLFTPSGEVKRILVHGLDLTAHKHMEQELQRRAEELALSDRKKDEFIALLAHELRNPLAPIRNGLQVLALSGNKPEVSAQVRDMMNRQLNHMVRLIDDLLDVSRMNRNKLFLRKSRVALAEAMNHALEATRPALEASGHELVVQLPTADLYLDADLTRLAQVFGNLISNSIKYTEPGGRISFTTEICGDEVVVTVSDNGIGIPTEALPNLFDMFSQVHGRERTAAGLGIGLALVRNLVEMHGGRVTAESDGSGQGSRFRVFLPLPQTQEHTESPAPAAPVAEPPPGTRVLVVDDNRDACASLAMLLEITGNTVRTAHDGLQAVKLAETFRPKLILMDIGMPMLDGYEATRRIRAQPWAADTTIVALTGWGQERDRLRSQEAGCDGHLVKPVSRVDLDALLQRLEPNHAH